MLHEPVLSLFSPLWAMTNSVARFARARSAARLPVPVVSVGNIVAGGVGKTEITAAIASHLLKRGKRVVVASRGYASEWERKGGVAQDFITAKALRFPDESLVLLKKVPGVSVAVGANRMGVLQKHWAELNPEVVLLDDGFQHFPLSRDLDVMVHDFSVKWPVLRDLPILLRRAQVRVAFSDVPPSWKDGSPWILARYALKGAVEGDDKMHALPPAANAFCGLGNPERFRQSLLRHGVEVGAFKTFPDHMEYREATVRELMAWHRARGDGLPLLTSLKDYVKLQQFTESAGGIAGFEPCWIKLELEFLENAARLWQAVDKVVDK